MGNSSDKQLYDIVNQYKGEDVSLFVIKSIYDDFNFDEYTMERKNETYYFDVEIVGEQSQTKIDHIHSDRELKKLIKRIKNILKIKELNVSYIDIVKSFDIENIMQDVANPNIKGFEWGENMHRLVNKVKQGECIEYRTM